MRHEIWDSPKYSILKLLSLSFFFKLIQVFKHCFFYSLPVFFFFYPLSFLQSQSISEPMNYQSLFCWYLSFSCLIMQVDRVTLRSGPISPQQSIGWVDVLQIQQSKRTFSDFQKERELTCAQIKKRARLILQLFLYPPSPRWT